MESRSDWKRHMSDWEETMRFKERKNGVSRKEQSRGS